MITLERLQELLNYDPETGIFTWKIDRGKCKAGTIAGSSWKGKYSRIRLDDQLYWSHSLVFLYMIGEVPEMVDHINRDGNDNRWCNLRECDKYQNAQNKPKQVSNSSGYIGVYRCSTTKRWVSQIRSRDKVIFLGRYNTPEEAAKIRDKKAVELHGEFAVLNFPNQVGISA